MTRTLLPILFAMCCLPAMPTVVAAAPVDACAMLSDADAARLAGAALGEVARHEVKPDDGNGNDQQSSCGHFPKGYHIESADGPPESGVLVELHAFRSGGEAKRFYEGVLGMHTDMQKASGGAGSKPTMVSGIGEGAYLLPTVLPSSPSKITTLTFLKGSVVAAVQVWKKAAAPDPIARAAAMLVLAKLP
jgi:hypothetical protein